MTFAAPKAVYEPAADYVFGAEDMRNEVLLLLSRHAGVFDETIMVMLANSVRAIDACKRFRTDD